MTTSSSDTRASSLRHVRPVQPLHFPEQEPDEERMGQGSRHLALFTALHQMVRAVAAPEHTVGADHFVYFDASNPRRCLEPDCFVTLGVPDHEIDSYKVWEEGAPDLAFEILSPSDAPERWTFEEKLERYHALGVRELVVLHADGGAGERLRVWDRIDGDLVERVVDGDTSPCLTLGLTLLVGPVEHHPVGLRVARDGEGKELVLTEAESRREAEAAKRAAEAAQRTAEAGQREAEAGLREAEAARQVEAEARARAEARIALLEKELAARGPR